MASLEPKLRIHPTAFIFPPILTASRKFNCSWTWNRVEGSWKLEGCQVSDFRMIGLARFARPRFGRYTACSFSPPPLAILPSLIMTSKANSQVPDKCTEGFPRSAPPQLTTAMAQVGTRTARPSGKPCLLRSSICKSRRGHRRKCDETARHEATEVVGVGKKGQD